MGLLKAAMQGGHNFVGAESFRTRNPAYSMFDHLKSDAYASSYPSIRAIANEYMAVLPKAIDGNGKDVKSPILDAFYHPNQTDSNISFAEKVAVSTLVHPKTYILVWSRDGLEAKPGGDFTVQTLAGFTFLERPGIERRDKKTIYKIGAQEFTEDEVIVLPGGVDPHDLYGGYSPNEAVRRWATLDDYIADFQTGFFENGAVPAGQFIITAPTATEYNDVVDMLQSRHRGAGKNGNVTYSHRPIDPNSGKPADAQVEWIPFAQANKDIDFKNLFDQVNKRIDVAYGVPAIIKGVDDAATYANAQVADKTFSKRAVLPLLLRNYAQFTHELNRITNGTGLAITFDYKIPTVADEEKVEAETKNIEASIIRAMVLEGYTLDSIIDSFKFSTAYKNLKLGNETATEIDNDKPDVDDGSEVKKSPDPEKIDGITPTNEVAVRKDPKATNRLTQADTKSREEELSITIRDHMSKQIEETINGIDSAQNALTEQQLAEFTDEMMQTIIATMVASGAIQYELGMALLIEAGLPLETTTRYEVTEAQEKAYRAYLLDIADSYTDDTASSIRAVLDRGNVEGWDRNELESRLRNIMNTDEWRVRRLAVSEINRSQTMSSIYSMQQINGEVPDAVVEKSLDHGGNATDTPCEYCRAYIDRWFQVDDYMIEKDQIIVGEDGGILMYTWDNNEGHDIHANGHCYPVFRVRQA